MGDNWWQDLGIGGVLGGVAGGLLDVAAAPFTAGASLAFLPEAVAGGAAAGAALGGATGHQVDIQQDAAKTQQVQADAGRSQAVQRMDQNVQNARDVSSQAQKDAATARMAARNEIMADMEKSQIFDPNTGQKLDKNPFWGQLAAQTSQMAAGFDNQQHGLSGTLAARGMLGSGHEAAMRAQLGGAQATGANQFQNQQIQRQMDYTRGLQGEIRAFDAGDAARASREASHLQDQYFGRDAARVGMDLGMSQTDADTARWREGMAANTQNAFVGDMTGMVGSAASALAGGMTLPTPAVPGPSPQPAMEGGGGPLSGMDVSPNLSAGQPMAATPFTLGDVATPDLPDWASQPPPVTSSGLPAAPPPIPDWTRNYPYPQRVF